MSKLTAFFKQNKKEATTFDKQRLVQMLKCLLSNKTNKKQLLLTSI